MFSPELALALFREDDGREGKVRRHHGGPTASCQAGQPMDLFPKIRIKKI